MRGFRLGWDFVFYRNFFGEKVRFCFGSVLFLWFLVLFGSVFNYLVICRLDFGFYLREDFLRIESLIKNVFLFDNKF